MGFRSTKWSRADTIAAVLAGLILAVAGARGDLVPALGAVAAFGVLAIL